jgi:hypothetical protein
MATTSANDLDLRGIVGSGLCLALLTVCLRSSAEDSACLEAASKGQTLRDVHKLVEAREQFRICARASCPGVVQKDCAAWLDEVEKVLPSVVFVLKDADGKDVVGAHVSEAGSMIATELDGTAIPMNPGMHDFRFELADGTRVEQSTLVREGQRAQNVIAAIPRTSEGSKTAPPAFVAAAPGAPEPTAPGSERSPAPLTTGTPSETILAKSRWNTWACVAGGVGLAGLAVGSVAGILAITKKHTADSHCTGPECDPTGTEAGNSGRSLANVATAGIGVGIAGLALGTVLWIWNPGSPPEREAKASGWRTEFQPLASGGLFLSAGRSW